MTVLPSFDIHRSYWIASSSLNIRGGYLLYHGWLIPMGGLPVSEEEQWRRSGWDGKRTGKSRGRGNSGWDIKTKKVK